MSKPAESTSGQSSPLSWLGRRAVTDPILTAGVTAAVPGWRDPTGGGGVLIRGVEVSSKEVADHTGFTRQHVLLSRTERETGVERAGATAQRCVRGRFLFRNVFPSNHITMPLDLHRAI